MSKKKQSWQNRPSRVAWCFSNGSIEVFPQYCDTIPTLFAVEVRVGSTWINVSLDYRSRWSHYFPCSLFYDAGTMGLMAIV